MGRLHDPANVQQTCSKCSQNTRANAGRLLDRVNTLLLKSGRSNGSSTHYIAYSFPGLPLLDRSTPQYTGAYFCDLLAEA